MVTISPESCFGKNCPPPPAIGDPASTTPSRWPQLQDLVQTFPFLAWLEDNTGRIFFSSNRLPNHPWPLPEHTLAAIRQSLQTQPRHCTVSIPDKYGRPIALKVTMYPLPYVDTAEHPLRLIALCPVSKELERDRIVISSLITQLLKTNHKEQADSKLTPQQHAIYQILTHGHRYKEIAACLGISHLTVRVQITRMRKILGPAFIPILRRAR
ncbi:helix-turn-helix transcriptional regulator [Geminisphaera colitermitum]|uniref:helix-turn-helix transcriptional regulator n=1 Tax=Geminisphaera colitermitum TaxID=1148786 RepID=UPI000158D130|nr:LuxR C-terminal-related transcriptional regulator [Geminisphaera colitermitum]